MSSTWRCQNMFCFFSVMQPMWPLILHQFRPFSKQKTWIGVCMHIPVKNFRMFAWVFFQTPKTDKRGNQATAQMLQFQAMGIILDASRHPKDVPFVREFWWGTYNLGTMSLWETPILVIGVVAYSPLAIFCPSRFSITSEGAAHSLRAYIAVSFQIHCNLSICDYFVYNCREKFLAAAWSVKFLVN